MRRVAIIGIVLVIAGGAFCAYFFWPFSGSMSSTPSSQALQNAGYAFDSLGIKFSYPKSYVFESYPLGDEEESWQSFMLVREADKASADANGASEGPVSINISIFQNPSHVSLENWIRTSPHSNFNLSSDQKLTPTTLGGQPAFSYQYSGLYESDAIAVLWQDQIYVLSVWWMDAKDAIRTDFANILKTVTFK